MRKLIPILILLIATVGFAQELTPRDTLMAYANDLRGFKKTVQWIGVTAKSEICLVQLNVDGLVFQYSEDGKVWSDDVFNAYLGNKGMQDHAKLQMDHTRTDPKTGAVYRKVAISSDVDLSGVELEMTVLNGKLVSGTFTTVRQHLYDIDCYLKAEVDHLL